MNDSRKKAGFLGCVLGCSIWAAMLTPSFAGDSFWGKVTEVRSADNVVLDNGKARFEVRLVGVIVPREGRLAGEAKDFVSRLVLGKNARVRMESKSKDTMIGELITDDPEIGFKDVGLELVRNGMARKAPEYSDKYGDLARAEREAREARRGVWAPAQPR